MPPPFRNNDRSTSPVGVVGPCSAGKTTLTSALRQLGINARHIAQEHSFVPSMWQQLVNPRYLIFLDVSYPVSIQRRPLNLSPKEFEDQQERLHHAKEHADLYLMTDPLSAEEVLAQVLQFLKLDKPPNQEYNATR